MSRRSVGDILGDDTPIEFGEIPESRGGAMDPHDIRQQGVGVTWLSVAFGMGIRKIKDKLVNLKPLGMRKTATGMSPHYSLREAAAFIVPPVGALSHAIRSMTKNDLPPQLRKEYWEAKQIEAEYRLQAGDLWHTDDVHAVFGSVFLMIKNKAQLWVETLSENSNLTNDQRRRLTELVDALQSDIHHELVELPKLKQTKPLVVELEQEQAEEQPQEARFDGL